MAKVFLCTPHACDVNPAFLRHILLMQSSMPQHEFIFSEVDSFVVGKARNMLVEVAIPNNADVTLWIDNDVMVPPHAVSLVDRALERGVCSGIYFNRRLPYFPQLYKRAEEPEHQGMFWPMLDFPEDEGLFKVDAIGFGLVAVRTDIFEKLTAFHTERFTKAADLIKKELGEDYIGIERIIRTLSPHFEFLNAKGEDLYFSERCAEAGIDIWVDPGVQAQHLGIVPIEKGHFDYIKKHGGIVIDKPIGTQEDMLEPEVIKAENVLSNPATDTIQPISEISPVEHTLDEAELKPKEVSL